MKNCWEAGPNYLKMKRKIAELLHADPKDFELEEDNEEDTLEIESIVDFKVEEGKTLYKVHWKGYPSEKDTWEPGEHLKNSKDLLPDTRKENNLNPLDRTASNSPSTLSTIIAFAMVAELFLLFAPLPTKAIPEQNIDAKFLKEVINVSNIADCWMYIHKPLAARTSLPLFAFPLNAKALPTESGNKKAHYFDGLNKTWMEKILPKPNDRATSMLGSCFALMHQEKLIWQS
uniref:Uncharacterized protein LOC117350759 n=1 Tax=Geotrypetes seraphini TaxID=260995 RepID=A0A6P8Q1R9_GEOSA|nr:uncharacterized protein LOC117350759 [Geotrypetes seraphini]XP_033781226.1 uncharacterized protein LOC117350759 [Geotrypetes seraphini]